MSIASEISRLQTSKADVKTQVNIDKDLINGGTAFIDDETVDDYDDKIEEMQEAYKKFIPIQTISGTEITLDNSSNDKALVDIGLDGNTEQDGEPAPDNPVEVKTVTGDNNVVVRGKNLFDKENSNVLNAYFTSTVTTITENANNRLIYIKCKPSTTYSIRRIKGDIFLSGYTKETPAIGISVYGWATSTPDVGTNDCYQVVTTGADAQYIVARITNINSDSVTLQQIYDTLQIEESLTPTTYEPYRVPTLYPINLGAKNLWKPSEALSGYLPQTGSYPTTNPSYPNSRYILVPLIKGQSLTINNQGSPTTNFRMRYIDPDTNLIVGTVIIGNNNNYVSSTIDYSVANYNGTVKALKNVILGLWDFLGEIESMIAVYGTSIPTISDNPIELAQIGTYTDKLYKDYDDGKWYKYNAIKKSTLGSDITFLSTTGGFYSATATDYATSGNTPYCEWYQGKNNTAAINGITDKEIAFNTSSSPYPRLYLKDSDYSSNTTLNSDLSANQVHIYYALATPTITEITNTTLIGQLEAIHLATGTNIIEFDGDTLVSGMDINYIGEASPHL